MELDRKGLTGSQIKTLGLILMIVDHVGHFFGDSTPSWFRLLGRLSAPLFIFMAAEGYYYTRNKEKRIRSLYIWGAITLVGNTLLERVLPISNNTVYLMNNIFLTLAVGQSLIYLIEGLKEEGPSLKRLGGLVFLSMASVLVEGSFVFVGLLIMFYFLREEKALKFGIYIVVSLLLGFSALKNGNWELLSLWENKQWFMVFSVIFMMAYNGEKGRGLGKYFFYIFYPVHVWLLYLLKYILLK